MVGSNKKEELIVKNKISVVGLGAGDINQLPLGIYRRLVNQENLVFVRTSDHPVIKSLEEEGLNFHSFDPVYEKHENFQSVYDEIVRQLLNEALNEDTILYAVPGHPMLAEKTVQLLLEQKDIEIEIIGGQSYLDALFTSLKIDPIEGFQFVDATAFRRSQLEYRQHLIFCQVYDAFVASEVKLELLEDLPPEHPITIVEAVGSDEETLSTVPLVELDQSTKLSNLTSVYIPPVSDEQLNHQFFRLRDIIASLRGPNGCPWDMKQTHESLRRYLIEEAYEFIEAVNNEDDEAMIEEIGDVLLQVMLHSQIGEDEGFFTIDDVIRTLTNKMIRRHPHVFAEKKINSEEEVVANWEQIKKQEKQGKETSLLENIPPELPSLLIAEQLQKKAAKVGFDWDDPEPIWDKIFEEVNEVKQAIAESDGPELESEIGDLLFAIVNIARYYKINPDLAIQRTNTKFKSRFQFMESKISEDGKEIEQLALQSLDYYWNLAKEQE